MIKRGKFLTVILFLCLFISVGFYAYAQQSATGKKAVFLIAANGFQDDEFGIPYAALRNKGVKVTVASTTLSEATGMNGAKAMPDVLLKDIKADDFDAVVFIGGSGAVQYLDDPVAHKLAQDAVAKQKVVGAICIAPLILTNAGVLSGKNATCYPTEGEKLKAGGVNYSAKPVEIEGNIITADGPKSAKEFGEAISKALGL